MIRLLFAAILSIPCINGYGQSIAGTDLAHWYNPSNETGFQFKVINSGDSLIVYYRLQVAGALTISDYSIEWDKRESYGQRNGDSLSSTPQVIYSIGKTEVGKMTFTKPAKPWLLVAKTKNKASGVRQLYFQKMESNYPVNGSLAQENLPLFSNYCSTESEVQLLAPAIKSPLYAFRYLTSFPAASPPFAEKENKVSPVLQADSVFEITDTTSLHNLRTGLYLIQQDTSSLNGFCFYVSDSSYPKFARLEDLIPPLIFICTKEEFEKLMKAGGNKKEFDKVILEITGNADRAKNFMRNYFRRVELANAYFTSYKEGWKTDRGMIYLIFGQPDEVNRTGDNEIWNYQTQKVRFTFVKSGSIYDPDYFVLVRDKRFGINWFNTIDLWRKGRY